MYNHEHIRPPGTYFDILGHPSGPSKSLEVAVMQDHRFAFFYWFKWYKWLERMFHYTHPPTLVSLDWHQDLAHPCDGEKAELRKLNLSNYEEVGFFCWNKLNPLNDGHIFSAAYLNFIDDIHVLQKQDEASEEDFKDSKGRVHKAFIYDSLVEFSNALAKLNCSSVFFDIDLDYFTESSDPCGGGEDVELMSEEEIRHILNVKGPLLSWILPRICGMTIATEPEFCGGLQNSHRLFAVVDSQLFAPQLLSENTKWRFS